jgi:hypothetical protein
MVKEEKEAKVKVTLSLTPETVALLNTYSALSGLSRSGLVGLLVTQIQNGLNVMLKAEDESGTGPAGDDCK